MRTHIVVALLIAFSLSAAAGVAAQQAAASASPQTVVAGNVVNSNAASISGTVLSPTGQPITDTVVQARNLLTGVVEGSTRTATGGAFSIGLPPGSYVLEIVDAGGQIVGTSSFIAAAAGATVAATVTATSGALTAVSTVTGLAATLTTTAAETVKFAAAAAGVAGVVTPAEISTASPSR